jgi:hypothetical protein
MEQRQTSIDTYFEIRDSGLLSEKRFEVYQILYKYGPMSGAQVSEIYRRAKNYVGHSESIRNRITELVDMGCAYEVKTDACPVTGRQVLWFDVNGELPQKLERKRVVYWVVFSKVMGEGAKVFRSRAKAVQWKLENSGGEIYEAEMV